MKFKVNDKVNCTSVVLQNPCVIKEVDPSDLIRPYYVKDANGACLWVKERTLEAVKEEVKMKFKKGDKVIVNVKAGFGETPNYNEDLKDVVCTFYSYRDVDACRAGIILPCGYKGHDLGGELKGSKENGRGWFVEVKNIKPVPIATPERWYKVGDYVEEKNKTTGSNCHIAKVIFIDDETGDVMLRYTREKNPDMVSKYISMTETPTCMDLLFKPYTPTMSIKLVSTPVTRKTIAVLKVEGVEKAIGIAKCNPTDKWDAEIGIQLATERMWEDYKKQQ